MSHINQAAVLKQIDAAMRENPLSEAESYLMEHAMQVGFEYLDDAATVFACTQRQLVDLVRARRGQIDRAPGMAVQALAGEIVAALLLDEKDGGYDLTAGMFGRAFSDLVRRWAAAEIASQRQERDAKRWNDLIELCGHLGDSSDTVVTLSQDDACRTQHIKVGERRFYGTSWGHVLDKAVQGDES